MNFDFLKNRKQQISITLLAASAFLAAAICLKAAGFAVSSARLPRLIEKALAQNNPEDESLKKHIAKNEEMAQGLKSKNMFSPSPGKPKPPTCTGILGQKALINNKWYGCGETAAGAKILEIGAVEVTVEWQGKEMKLAPIKTAAPAEPKKPKQQPKVEPAGEEEPPQQPQPTQFRERGRGRRGPFGRMSREERQKMREKLANMSPEERQQYMEQMRAERQEE